MAEFKSVLLARTMVEAQIAEAALQEAGIACVVENFTSDPYDGMWVLQRGYGRILVQRGRRGTRARDHRGSAGRRAAAGRRSGVGGRRGA